MPDTNAELTAAHAAFLEALDARRPALEQAIRTLLAERPFVLDPGDADAMVDAIHFEYDWESFQPVAIALDTAAGYCGRGLALMLPEPLIPDSVEAAMSRAMEDDDDDFVDALRQKMTATWERWFRQAWQAASAAASRPMRGFLSVHDTIWRIDLDTGIRFRADEGQVKFFR